MQYPGGKNGSGVYQKLISMMPKHKTYIELFLGSGAILRRKRAAQINMGVDLDADVLDVDSFDILDNLRFEGVCLYHQNAIDFVKESPFLFTTDALVYADPPYLRSVRSSKGKIYKHEFWADEQHTELLNALKTLKSMVMISGYDSPLYNQLLGGWRKEQFQTTNRAGQKVIETVWLNFDEPRELHDYSFLGKDKTDRQRIKRKASGWINKLKNLPAQERYAIMAEIENYKSQLA